MHKPIQNTRLFPLLLLLFCVGCYRNHLYVQQEWVDVSFLASSHVPTPDPRQEDPPEGQRLIVAWRLPESHFAQNPYLHVTVRLWDGSEECRHMQIPSQRGCTAFFYSQKDPDETCSEEEQQKAKDLSLLTYRVQVCSQTGEVLEVWEHPFWTEAL